MKAKSLEIFCGTGGVGKTTTATARALALSLQGKKVLLITIDPSKRLKQILNIHDEQAGEIVTSKLQDHHFDVLLMSPPATLKRIAHQTNTEKEMNTNIIKTLIRPNAGMNEIMSIIEVQYQMSRQCYDVIILDTPPGKHFIDFLESSQKIKSFFDETFVEIFNFLDKNLTAKDFFTRPKALFSVVMSSGIKKLLNYLETVTGGEFVDEFIQTMLALYKNRDTFLKALDFQKELLNPSYSSWFLVTSVEQFKIEEALELKGQASKFIRNNENLIINKSLLKYLEHWTPEESELIQLKMHLKQREADLKEICGQNFHNILEFPEILHSSPESQVIEMAKNFLEAKIN